MYIRHTLAVGMGVSEQCGKKMCKEKNLVKKRWIFGPQSSGRQESASVGRAVGFMVDDRMMLGAVVAPVERAPGPAESELSVDFTATQPVETHVHGLGLTWHDSVVGDTSCSGVVSLERRGWLRPVHFNEHLA